MEAANLLSKTADAFATATSLLQKLFCHSLHEVGQLLVSIFLEQAGALVIRKAGLICPVTIFTTSPILEPTSVHRLSEGHGRVRCKGRTAPLQSCELHGKEVWQGGLVRPALTTSATRRWERRQLSKVKSGARWATPESFPISQSYEWLLGFTLCDTEGEKATGVLIG